MFKRLLIIGVVGVLSLFSIGAAAADQPAPRQFNLPIKVLYNARQIVSDVQPEIKNDVVFVPFRAVANALGAKLDVTPDWKTITFTRGDRKVTITIGSKTAYVNGQKKELLVAPYPTKGRTMVPTRFVSEQLGETVEWDSLSRYVWIGHKNVPTLEEVTEKVDIEPYLHYFTGVHADDVLEIGDYRSSDFGKQHTTVRIIKETDWPLVIAGTTITRIDRVVIDGNEYFRAVSTKKGLLGTPFYILQKGQPLKLRGENNHMREYAGDLRAFYNNVIDSQDEWMYGVKNYKNLKLKDAEYIGILTTSDSVILMENYFK
jgi:hypothetical protein